MTNLPSRFRVRYLRGGTCKWPLWAGVFLLLCRVALAQEPPQGEIKQQLGGMSTGAAHAPVKDALSRPITAGGFIDGAPVVFVDITHAAGLDKFHHKTGDL